MPTTFLISPFQPPVWDRDTDLFIQIDEYTSHLSQRWTNHEIAINPTAESYVASWRLITDKGEEITGGLQRGQRVVSCQGTIEGIIEFALWHREIIEEKYRLFLFDDGLHINLEIGKNTGRDEISESMKAHNSTISARRSRCGATLVWQRATLHTPAPSA